MEYEYHEAANIFPMMLPDELDALTESIEKNGLRRRIKLCDGKIIDGRNRYGCCKRAGVDPEFETIAPDDPVQYVLDLNLVRRHLNEAQRATVAAKSLGFYSNGKTPKLNGRAREKAAKALNVSTRSVSTAKQVIEKAEPEVVSAVENGQLSLNSAVQVAELPKQQQKKIAKADKPKTAAKKALNSVKVHSGMDKVEAGALKRLKERLPMVRKDMGLVDLFTNNELEMVEALIAKL